MSGRGRGSFGSPARGGGGRGGGRGGYVYTLYHNYCAIHHRFDMTIGNYLATW